MEHQPTSGEAGSCCEARKELLGEVAFPLSGKMEQLARSAQVTFPLRTAELVRRHGAHEAVTGGGWIPLLEQVPAHGERSQLASQPGEHPPDGRMVQRPFIDGRSVGRRLVAGGSVPGPDRLAIRLPVVLQVIVGEIEERLLGVALIGKYESRDNR